jgi:NADH dehydrogenase
MSTVDVTDVQQLLDSTQEDPVLVLRQGKPMVIAAHEQEADEYRGSLFLTSRRTLLGQAGQQGGSQPDMERLAAALSAMADQLGA